MIKMMIGSYDKKDNGWQAILSLRMVRHCGNKENGWKL